MTAREHEDWDELLGPAALGVLDPREQALLDRHLRTCARCRDELAELAAVTARLAALDPGGLEPAFDPAPVMLELARERQRRRRGQVALAAAASFVVLCSGVVTAAALRTAEPTVPLEPVAVSATGQVRASADLVAHTWGVEIKLTATGLTDGAAYSVRVVDRTGRSVGAGAFLGTGERTLLCNLNAAVLRPDAAAFTVLDGTGRQVLSAKL